MRFDPLSPNISVITEAHTEPQGHGAWPPEVMSTGTLVVVGPRGCWWAPRGIGGCLDAASKLSQPSLRPCQTLMQPPEVAVSFSRGLCMRCMRDCVCAACVSKCACAVRLSVGECRGGPLANLSPEPTSWRLEILDESDQ